MASHVQRRRNPLFQNPVPGSPMQFFRSGLSDLKFAPYSRTLPDPSVLDLLLQNLSGPINSGLHSLRTDAEKLRALLLRTAFDGE